MSDTIYCSLRQILETAVIKIVTGIKNSTTLELILKTSSATSAKVMECPMVKAVTNINTRFQSVDR